LFTATPHQVIDLPRYKDIIPERYSIAFFCNVNKDVVLDPMTHLNDNGSGARTKTYEPIKAIDYITMRLSQTISST
jgi:isopenicillin N synthase-like dioxygenase